MDDRRILAIEFAKYFDQIDVQTGKVSGSFDVDSILVRINGEWLWDDIPVVY